MLYSIHTILYYGVECLDIDTFDTAVLVPAMFVPALIDMFVPAMICLCLLSSSAYEYDDNT